MSARNGHRSKNQASGGNGASSSSPTAALTVRPANPGDLVPLSFFFDTVLRRDYFVRRGQLADIVNGRHHQVFVAEIDAVLVGVAITTRGARLVNALVHPCYRGLGIGKHLIHTAGVTEVRAKIDMSTGDPRGFYRSLGFRSTGVKNSKGNIELMRAAKSMKRASRSSAASPTKPTRTRRSAKSVKTRK